MKNKSLLLSQNEELMTDLEQDLENVLMGLFCVESDESLQSLEERSIYDLSTEKEIEDRKRREAKELNDGSVDIEDLEGLYYQATKYFEHRAKVSIDYDDAEEEMAFVTGYVQIESGIRFNEQGEASSSWKTFGEKIVFSPSDLLNPEFIIKRIEDLGIEWNEMVRIVFYGKYLDFFVGQKFYSKDEKREVVPLSEDFRNILLAVPEYDSSLDNDSIFNFVEQKIKDSILYGEPLEVDRVTIGHWEMTLTRLDELKIEEQEAHYLESLGNKQKHFVQQRNGFDERFKEARGIIQGLNSGNIKIKDLFEKSSEVLNQVMYLCHKKEERLETPAIYFQLKGLVNKKKLEMQMPLLNNKKLLSMINSVNKGEHLEIHLVSYDDLDDLFKILWGDSGLKIKPEYKEVYFQLKERYQYLQKIHSANKKAA